jgi:hypothetical protein
LLSFSEQAQEHWASEIPACVIRASYLATTKGPVFTWGQYKLCQTGKDCLGMWPWVSSTSVESVFQERPPTTAYLRWNSQVDLLSLSLCLVKEGFFLGKLRKRSKPTTAVRQAIWETQRPGRGLYCTANATWAELDFSAPRLFLFSSP